MGYYINQDSKGNNLGLKKVDGLLADGAIKTDPVFQKNLVCVIDNGVMDAAGYCYSESEFKEFSRNDGRRKTWLIVNDAAKLSGYDS